MSNNMNKVKIAESRARLYLFFSKIFLKEVTLDFLRSLKNKNFLDTLKDMDAEIDINFFNQEDKEVLKRFAEEYGRLFVTPGSKTLPYESVCLMGLLAQEPAEDALAFYKKGGFILSEDFKGFPDHIGVELAFIGYLAQEESKRWKEGKEEDAQRYAELQRDFLKEHLGRWAFRFCRGVMDNASLPFYKEMARLTYTFLESEMEEMGLKVDAKAGSSKSQNQKDLKQKDK